MGYDLHITRRLDWSDSSGPAISQSEWQQAIGNDPDTELFFWSDGEVSVKNPDSSLIAKMVCLAENLSARVQGDDGEIYREDGSSFEPSSAVKPEPRPGLFRRFASAWRSVRNVPSSPFRVGQRVKESVEGLGTVVFVDAKAYGGLGSLKVKMDNGREHHRACVASGFEIVDDE